MKLYLENNADKTDKNSLTQSLARFANHFGGAHHIISDRRVMFGEPEMVYAVNRVWQPLSTNHMRRPLSSNQASRFYSRGINLAD